VIAISDWNNPTQLGVKYDAERPDHQLPAAGLDVLREQPGAGRPGKLLGEANSNDMIVKGGDRLSITKAFGLNSKWTLAPDWKLEGDVSTSRSTSASRPTCGWWPAWCRRTATC
jgi:iron complex outermembrane receptor protein